MAGCDLYLKLENMQKTGSFKIRGAYNKIRSLTPESGPRGLLPLPPATMPKEWPMRPVLPA